MDPRISLAVLKAISFALSERRRGNFFVFTAGIGTREAKMLELAIEQRKHWSMNFPPGWEAAQYCLGPVRNLPKLLKRSR